MTSFKCSSCSFFVSSTKLDVWESLQNNPWTCCELNHSSGEKTRLPFSSLADRIILDASTGVYLCPFLSTSWNILVRNSLTFFENLLLTRFPYKARPFVILFSTISKSPVEELLVILILISTHFFWPQHFHKICWLDFVIAYVLVDVEVFQGCEGYTTFTTCVLINLFIHHIHPPHLSLHPPHMSFPPPHVHPECIEKYWLGLKYLITTYMYSCTKTLFLVSSQLKSWTESPSMYVS